MKNKFDRIQKIVFLIIIFGIICRLIPHPPNFSPVTAIALFGGLNFSDKRIAFSIPLVVLFLSDLILGISMINLFVYTGFLLIVFLGTKIKSIKFGNIILSSFIFFLISNFGVWIIGYPKNIEGLILCYTMAIPFFGYSIAGDLFFGYLFKFSFGKITSILPRRIN
tara:strand:+ start:196 stop:693 length:498 start_codon:yes stop_codon:yes gene_type:complete